MSMDNNTLTLESRIQMITAPSLTTQEFTSTSSLCIYCKHSVITRYSIPNYKDIVETGKPTLKELHSISTLTEVCCSQKHMRLIEHQVASCQLFSELLQAAE